MGVYEPVHKPHLGTVATPCKDQNSANLDTLTGVVICISVYWVKIFRCSSKCYLSAHRDKSTPLIRMALMPPNIAWSNSCLIDFARGVKLNPTQPPLPFDP
jgi:hypothetical protein